jgi:hypothetical protein
VGEDDGHNADTITFKTGDIEEFRKYLKDTGRGKADAVFIEADEEGPHLVVKDGSQTMWAEAIRLWLEDDD